MNSMPDIGGGGAGMLMTRDSACDPRGFRAKVTLARDARPYPRSLGYPPVPGWRESTRYCCTVTTTITYYSTVISSAEYAERARGVLETHGEVLLLIPCAGGFGCTLRKAAGTVRRREWGPAQYLAAHRC